MGRMSSNRNRPKLSNPSLREGASAFWLSLFLLCLPHSLLPEETGRPSTSIIPDPLENADFDELKSKSPFLRAIDPSASLILVGLARIDGGLVATLRERETKKTHILSGADNEEGWRVVGVEGDFSDPATVAAQIAVEGEVYAIRYDQQQLNRPPPLNWRKSFKLSKEQQEDVVRQARDFRRGISGDGHRGATPPELANRLSRLSQGQREEIIARLADMRNRGISSEVRQKAISSMTDRALGVAQ